MRATKPYSSQLTLFDLAAMVPAPIIRLYDHEKIMSERTTAIRALCIQHFRFDAAQADAECAVQQRQLGARDSRAQEAALFWQGKWEELRGRTNAWCVMCDYHLDCPVNTYLLDEARRVNAPKEI